MLNLHITLLHADFKSCFEQEQIAINSERVKRLFVETTVSRGDGLALLLEQ